MAAIARTLLQTQDVSRDLFLFDTFEGMTPPTATDVDYLGKRAAEVLLEDPGYRCADAPLEQVKEMLYASGYPQERFHFVRGRVEESIPASAPEKISLLRLDTDCTRRPSMNLFTFSRDWSAGACSSSMIMDTGKGRGRLAMSTSSRIAFRFF